MDKKILIIDDEVHILELLKLNLEIYGYEVVTSESGEKVMDLIKDVNPDLILLDLMLPGLNGIDICKQIRNNPDLNRIRIVILSAKSEEIDKIVCLEIGADDYVTKPFSLRELIARVGAVFRRMDPSYCTEKIEDSNENNSDDLIFYKDLKIDAKNNIIYKNNNALDFTSKEFKLFLYLLQNKGTVITREKIFEHVWNYENNQSRSLDVHIRKIRIKLEDKNNSYIETVRGIGYIIPKE